MSETLTPDICVIGAGSGGLSVAAIAAAFGVSCVLIEKDKMGGDCLNYGCVPSKAMIAAAKHAEAIRHAPGFGVTAGDPQVNFGRVSQHVKGVIAAIAPNDSVERFTGLGVHVIKGEARFKNDETVIVGNQEIKARRFVIATGSSPATPPILGLDSVDYFTNETIFSNTRKPAHLIVVGGGPIGIELAQAHHRLGAKVTVLEAFDMLGMDDPELTEIVLDAVQAEGVDLKARAKVSHVGKHGNGVRVKFETDQGVGQIDGSHLLLAAGRTPNIGGLDLDKAGISLDGRSIKTNAALRTTNKRVYAIGDVAGGPQFTHVANYHAGLVIQSILFRIPAKANHDIMPWVTYADPELAHVGLNEEMARKRHKDRINVLRWPYAENDRAQAERKTTGLIKIITDRKGRILGASIVGAQAGELINMWSLAISQKMKIGAMRGFTSPYPTLSEISKRASVTFYADVPQKPFVRKLLAFLRRFG